MESFLFESAASVAPRLLGCELLRVVDGKTLRARIVETEAYNQTDAASHSYNGRTPRNDVMFGPAGFLYVYFTYGMHYCCNVVTGAEGNGSAVLIRAVEPVEGLAIMEQARGRNGVDVVNGPAKLCQALSIDKQLNGHDLSMEPMQLIIKPALPVTDITVAPRIGISKAQDAPLRFYITGNKFVSRLA